MLINGEVPSAAHIFKVGVDECQGFQLAIGADVLLALCHEFNKEGGVTGLNIGLFTGGG